MSGSIRNASTRFATALASSSETPTTTKFHQIYKQTHQQLQRSIQQWIDRSVNPNVDEWEATGEFPGRKLFKELGEIGALGTTKPIDYDGLGLDYSYAIAVAEQIGNIKCGSIPMAICVQTDMATPALATYGSDYLKKEFLTPSVSGDRISCIAVSESSGGSDVAAIKTTASRSHLAGSTDLVVKGEKCWITNGIQADWACLLANTSAEPSHRNKSLICVPLNLPGIHRVPLAKSGMLCSDTAQIFFDDVKVPKCHIIGEEGDGFIYQMKQFQDERLVTVAVALSPLQRCIDETIEYTRNRRIFGSTILGQQYIQYNLAEMQTELEAVRSLLYRAVETRLSGEDVTMLASMGKLIIGKLARKITDSCMQMWGAVGMTPSCPISRIQRDLRVFSIGAGCDEVMMSIICKHMQISDSPRKK